MGGSLRELFQWGERQDLSLNGLDLISRSCFRKVKVQPQGIPLNGLAASTRSYKQSAYSTKYYLLHSKLFKNNFAPSYVQELITLKPSTKYSLRSDTSLLLSIHEGLPLNGLTATARSYKQPFRHYGVLSAWNS